jgi:hypothetical protein
MKTYKKVTYQAEKTIIDSCLCNMCGREVSFEMGDGSEPKLQHAITLKVIGEYRHCSLQDMTVLWIDLCEDCLTKEIICRLTIKPTEGDDFSWIRPEREAKEEEFSEVKCFLSKQP